jgi:hypothetical protein
LWRKRPAPGPPKDLDKPADGAFQAMDQIANWVRFADTKATILIAGLGVVLTMVVANVRTVINAIDKGTMQAVVLYPLSGVAALAFMWTLFWLLTAIRPRRATTNPGLNRFAWPTLSDVDADTLMHRGTTDDASEDAWRQVVDLSRLAAAKFAATANAVWGFGAAIVVGAALVVTSMAFTHTSAATPTKSGMPAPHLAPPATPGAPVNAPETK